MDNKQDIKSIVLSEYAIRRMRKDAYAQYYYLEKKRDERHEREAAWDSEHKLGPIGRWVINIIRGIKDIREENMIEDALDIANPMAGFHRWKEQHKNQ